VKSAITFIGGAGTVTGSKTIIDTPGGRIMVDCGLFQGRKQLRLQNWEPFPVDPASIDAIVLTHAHIDHCGYIPRLMVAGFNGPVICTSGTERLAGIVLPDSGHLQEEDADFANRHGFSKHIPALPLYTEADARRSLGLFQPVDFDHPTTVIDGVDATWRRAGHILGAASIDIHIKSSDKHVVFSGDLGRSTHPLLRPPAPIGRADVVVVESTYGNRTHDDSDPAEVIADVVNRAAKHGGVVIIPAFAVDRTEVVLWHLDKLVATGAVPDIPVFVDSPMASRALEVYRSEARHGSPEIRSELHGRELFGSVDLTEIPSWEESQQLSLRRGPMIIVSASGMATGGRVVHHLADRLGDHRNAVLMVGFQAPGSRGDALQNGVPELKMFGRKYPVRAKVRSVELSAHADQTDLVDWIDSADSPPIVVHVNHGEPSGSEALAALLHEKRSLDARVAEPGKAVEL